MKEVGYMSDEFHGRFEPPPASVRMIPNPQNSDTPHSKKQKHILYSNPNLAHIYEWHISTSTSIAMGLSNWLVSGLLTHYVLIKIHLLTS